MPIINANSKLYTVKKHLPYMSLFLSTSTCSSTCPDFHFRRLNPLVYLLNFFSIWLLRSVLSNYSTDGEASIVSKLPSDRLLTGKYFNSNFFIFIFIALVSHLVIKVLSKKDLNQYGSSSGRCPLFQYIFKLCFSTSKLMNVIQLLIKSTQVRGDFWRGPGGWSPSC